MYPPGFNFEDYPFPGRTRAEMNLRTCSKPPEPDNPESLQGVGATKEIVVDEHEKQTPA